MAGWTCNGIPRNKEQYAADRLQSHEPYLNYGSHCLLCGLSQEEVVEQKESTTGLRIALAVGAILTTSVLAIGYLLRPQSCPYGQKHVNGACTAIYNPSSNRHLSSSVNRTSSESQPANLDHSFLPVATLAEVNKVPTMKVRYGGSTSFAPLRTKQIVERISMVHPGFDLIYVEPTGGQKPGSTTGIKMLLDGQLSLAQSSRPLREEEYNLAKNHGFALEQQAIAIDGLAIFVNPQLPISGLTISNLKDIYTGKIVNWKQLGGPDLPIKPFSRDLKAAGTSEYFWETVLDRQPFTSSLQPVTSNPTDSIAKVAKTVGGIGYGTAAEACNQSRIRPLAIAKEAGQKSILPCDDKQVNQVAIVNNIYPITRRLFVIIKRDGRLDEQAGLAYVNLFLSNEGQQLVEEAGLAKIR